MRSNQRVIDGPGGQIELVNLTKTYDRAPVLKGINLSIERGEFFSLLGPSGCGKTTTLRLIGGFESADTGEVRIDGVDMVDVPPENRPVNTVFQSYALFPHLSVAENVAFGLRFQKASKAETTTRVGDALELVRLSSYGKRKAHQLSGGQQQRVALARALVLRPKVLLLDEPLGALDAKLRKTLQVELRALHQDVGITFVYVTHDQEEALTMSDRMAVMNDGEIEQIGTPKETYEEPASAYVADFLGVANLLPAKVTTSGRVLVNGSEHSADTAGVSGDCTILIRPERVLLAPLGTGQPEAVPAVVEQRVYVGAVTQVLLRLGEYKLQALIANDGSPTCGEEGESVDAYFPPNAIRVLTS
ncbi:MAG TPA: ABC transporter ATP-binding protein [Ilumatobacteraceae bacterium]|jgi:spermidine/putrescine transport system ATP-binding protein|nr:ABC transporter ATP-binding protein [Ilumatobacteraceae bacterium]